MVHANFLHDPGREAFVAELVEQAHTALDSEIETMLRGTWREKLLGAYLAGLSRRTAFRDQIGTLLVESATYFAGQGYCFALAAFGGPDDAEWLATYLDRWLPEVTCEYDQPWAMGALLHIDPVRAETFVDAWLNWTNRLGGRTDERETIKTLCHL